MAKNEELNIQSDIVSYLRLNNILVFSVPNGSYFARVATRMLMRRSGLLSGVSDLIIVLKNKVVFAEIKTPKGRQSDNQKEFEHKVTKLGFSYEIWRSLDDAINWYKEFNNGRTN